MKSPWEPEIEVDRTLARALIAEQFPDLREASVEPFGVGWDNTAYLVDASIVFRFPRRADAVPLLEREAMVLPKLAARLPVPTPIPTRLGVASPTYPWPFAGYRLLEGKTACRVVLDSASVDRLAEPIAGFLGRLHSIADDEARRIGAGPDTSDKLDVVVWKERGTFRLVQAEAAGSLTSAGSWRAVIDATAAEGAPARSTLCHGDLYARHLLLGDDGSLQGVIDWGDLHVGDPAVDLMVAWLLFAGEARERFWASYGVATAREQELARFRAICHSASALLYAIEVRDHDLERACRFGLANTLES